MPYCWKEYQVPERPKPTESSKELPLHEKEENEEVGRKRVAHPSAATCVTRQTGVNQQGKKVINPQQKMYERWRLMRDAVVEKTISTVTEGGSYGGGGGGCTSSNNVIKDVRRNYVETAATTCNSELKLNGGNGNVINSWNSLKKKKYPIGEKKFLFPLTIPSCNIDFL